MTITLEIPNTQEKELVKIASERGQDPETFLLSLLDEAILFGDLELIPDDDVEGYAASLASFQHSIDSIEAGRCRPVAQVFADMEARHGIPS